MTVDDSWSDNDTFHASDENAIAKAVNALARYDRVPNSLQTLPRFLTTNDVPSASGTLHLGYDIGVDEFSVSVVHTYCGGTAASALTLCRFGIYSVSPVDGTHTLVSSTANDTTLFGSTFAPVNKSLVTPTGVVQGTKYAIGALLIGGTAPNIGGVYVNQNEASAAPVLNGIVPGLSDLPSTIAQASINPDYRIPYIRVSNA